MAQTEMLLGKWRDGGHDSSIAAPLLAALLTGCGSMFEPAFQETLVEEDRRSVEIADRSVALTFARVTTPGGLRLLGVTAWKDGTIEGIDLGALCKAGDTDASVCFASSGYDAIASEMAKAEGRLSVAADSLVLPVDFRDHHVAVGTNYPEHASESGTTHPFLFPKMVQPTVSGDDVRAGSGLLDYEVEIAVMTLSALAPDAKPAFLGFFAANDFTDRETLMHAIDRHDVESGKGFTTGKSFPGYLPLGPLFVVPRDYRSFSRELEIRLYVNGQLRQRARGDEMVWDVDEILRQVFARKDVCWDFRGSEVSLYGQSPGSPSSGGERESPAGSIPARTLVLTGTPHGTVFAGVPRSVIASGVASWLFGGFLSRGPAEQVIESYISAARDARAYLQPGDEVLIHIPRLGQILSKVR